MIENSEQENFGSPLYAKVSPLQFLRQQDRAYKSNLKHQKRNIKRRTHLAAHIEFNDNIFQLGPERINRKAAQNILWEKNYKLKMAINILKEENSSLKARLWNFQKENRKMDKQIESWNLEKLFATSRKKPYIDMATVCKVFSDQDYEIVSNKITIAQLERVLEQKQNVMEELASISNDEKKELSKKSYLISQQKYSLIKYLREEAQKQGQNNENFETNFIEDRQKRLTRLIGENTDKCEILKKKNELKKKANQQHLAQLELCLKDTSNYTHVNEEQIGKMKQLMRKMKLEQQENAKDLKKELKGVQNAVMAQQCEIQDMMGVFIQKKIQLHQKIKELRYKMKDQHDLCCSQDENS